jgi:hypothetical protein
MGISHKRASAFLSPRTGKSERSHWVSFNIWREGKNAEDFMA